MGVSRDSRHKRRLTGGKRAIHQKKRKSELGRPPSMTKLGTEKRLKYVRCRGGNLKQRALMLEKGNFSWGTESCTRKSKIIDVVYNSTNVQMVQSKILVKNSIVEIDSTPFKQWYESFYGIALGKQMKKDKEKKEEDKKEEDKKEEKTASSHALRNKAKLTKERKKNHTLEKNLEEQFITGRLYACISSRPGQCGRADGYILEGKELEFYLRKLNKKH